MNFENKILHEKIKSELIFYIDNINSMPKKKYSIHLSDKFSLCYGYLGKIFNHFENKTIKEFVIELKIERVKQMLINGEREKDIILKLNFANAGHLSNCFKKNVGMTPTDFKKLKYNAMYA